MIPDGMQEGAGEPDPLAREILDIGFRCLECGTCCRGEDHLVLVMPEEVRPLLAASGGRWEDAVEPYPEVLEGGDGSRFHLGWCLRKDAGSCRYLSWERCTVYTARPRICRTYPFMLHAGRLEVSPCPGLGAQMSREEARAIAGALRERAIAETAEEERVARVLSGYRIPAGLRCVVDTDGIRVLDG